MKGSVAIQRMSGILSLVGMVIAFIGFTKGESGLQWILIGAGITIFGGGVGLFIGSLDQIEPFKMAFLRSMRLVWLGLVVGYLAICFNSKTLVKWADAIISLLVISCFVYLFVYRSDFFGKKRAGQRVRDDKQEIGKSRIIARIGRLIAWIGVDSVRKIEVQSNINVFLFWIGIIILNVGFSKGSEGSFLIRLGGGMIILAGWLEFFVLNRQGNNTYGKNLMKIVWVGTLIAFLYGYVNSPTWEMRFSIIGVIVFIICFVYIFRHRAVFFKK